MAFEHDTNLGRVQKMIETLQLIVKSAHSNRADDEAIRDMLRPLTDEMAAPGANVPRPVAEPSRKDRGPAKPPNGPVFTTWPRKLT